MKSLISLVVMGLPMIANAEVTLSGTAQLQIEGKHNLSACSNSDDIDFSESNVVADEKTGCTYIRFVCAGKLPNFPLGIDVDETVQAKQGLLQFNMGQRL